MHQIRTIASLEFGRRIFFDLPLGNAAVFADIPEPFIPQPARSPAVAGIPDYEALIAVGRNQGLVLGQFNRFNAMEDSPARWPQFNFIKQPEKLDPFAVISRCWFFIAFFIVFHKPLAASTSMVATPIWSESCKNRSPIISSAREHTPWGTPGALTQVWLFTC